MQSAAAAKCEFLLVALLLVVGAGGRECDNVCAIVAWTSRNMMWLLLIVK